MNNKPGTCSTRYPLLLVHGVGFRDREDIFNYWGRIPEELKKEGATLFFGHQDAWASIEHNAELLAKRVDEILRQTGSSKVNIIAHSRGGLEARYMICALKKHRKVASLTTIATPHHGSRIVDHFMKLPDSLYRGVSKGVDFWFRLLGDRNPDFYTGSRQLSAEFCREFNKKFPDHKSVYYQSYSAGLKRWYSDPVFLFNYVIIRFFEGKNDGLCSVDSGKWGNYRGMITGSGAAGVSHAGVIDLYRIDYPGLDMRQVYKDMVSDLKVRGY